MGFRGKLFLFVFICLGFNCVNLLSIPLDEEDDSIDFSVFTPRLSDPFGLGDSDTSQDQIVTEVLSEGVLDGLRKDPIGVCFLGVNEGPEHSGIKDLLFMCRCGFIHSDEELKVECCRSHRQSVEQDQNDDGHKCLHTGCSKVLLTNRALIRHMAMCKFRSNGLRSLTCKWDGCNCSFDNEEDFYSHVAEHIKELKDPSSKCKWDSCGRLLRTRGELLIHVRSHTYEKPFGCPHKSCSSKFSQINVLTNHLKGFHKEKASDFKCPYRGCNRSYAYAGVLATHLKNVDHSDKGKFQLSPKLEKILSSYK